MSYGKFLVYSICIEGVILSVSYNGRVRGENDENVVITSIRSGMNRLFNSRIVVCLTVNISHFYHIRIKYTLFHFSLLFSDKNVPPYFIFQYIFSTSMNFFKSKLNTYPFEHTIRPSESLTIQLPRLGVRHVVAVHIHQSHTQSLRF